MFYERDGRFRMYPEQQNHHNRHIRRTYTVQCTLCTVCSLVAQTFNFRACNRFILCDMNRVNNLFRILLDGANLNGVTVYGLVKSTSTSIYVALKCKADYLGNLEMRLSTIL